MDAFPLWEISKLSVLPRLSGGAFFLSCRSTCGLRRDQRASCLGAAMHVKKTQKSSRNQM